MLDQSISAMPKAMSSSLGNFSINWVTRAVSAAKPWKTDMKTRMRTAMAADQMRTECRRVLSSCTKIFITAAYS